MCAEWTDIGLVDGLFTVKAKEHWKPKDYEEREIPLPDFLVAALKKRMLATNGSSIFPQQAASSTVTCFGRSSIWRSVQDYTESSSSISSARLTRLYNTGMV